MAEEAGAELINMDVTYGPEIRFVAPERDVLHLGVETHGAHDFLNSQTPGGGEVWRLMPHSALDMRLREPRARGDGALYQGAWQKS